MIQNPHNKIRGVWRFNNSLEDEISTNNFVTDQVPQFNSFSVFDFVLSKQISKRGLVIKNGTMLNAGSDFDFAADGYASIVLFWWYSPAPLGQVKHTVTRQSTPALAPIVAKATPEIANGTETISSGEWVIMEIGASKTHNAIRLCLCENGESVTKVIDSTPYLPGLHHIAFLYWKNEVNFVTIFIDGKPSNYVSRPSEMIVSHPTDLRINEVIYGHSAHRKIQDGAIISELVVANIGGDNVVSFPLKMMRFGLEFIVESDTLFNDPTFNGFVFEQSSTITTKQIIKSGEDVIVTRSDGSFLLGQRPIWDNNIDFNKNEDLLRLKSNVTDDCPPNQDKRTMCLTSTGLHVRGVSIRV